MLRDRGHFAHSTKRFTVSFLSCKPVITCDVIIRPISLTTQPYPTMSTAAKPVKITPMLWQLFASGAGIGSWGHVPTFPICTFSNSCLFVVRHFSTRFANRLCAACFANTTGKHSKFFDSPMPMTPFLLSQSLYFLNPVVVNRIKSL